jgi:hypothetical protein
VNPRTVTPGGTATVVVKGRPPGAGEKEVFVRTATNAKPTLELSLKLTMVGAGRPPYVAYHSPSFRFGTVTEAGSSDSVSIDTREERSKEPWLREAVSTLPNVVCRGGLESEFDAGGGVVIRRYQYSAELIDYPPPGEFRGDVLIKSAKPDLQTVVTIPLHGVVQAPVYASPSVLLANVGPSGKVSPLTLRIRAAKPGQHLEVKARHNELMGLIIRQIASPDANSSMFEISISDRLDQSVSTTLVFETDHAEQTEVQVPLRMVLAKAED